jgi:hypothetical protein
MNRPSSFKHAIMTQTKLLFLPHVPFRSTSANLGCSSVSQAVEVRGLRSDSQQTATSIVEGSPCVVLVATLPSAAITLNQSIPLTLFVKAARSSDTLPEVKLRTLNITLRTTTTVNNETEKIAWSTSKNVFSATQLNILMAFERQGDDAVCEIDSSLWSDAYIQGQTPSFMTCTATQEHSLVITAGISSFSNTDIMVTNVPPLLDVTHD